MARAVAFAVALVVAPAVPAAAGPTSASIDAVTRSGSTVEVRGRLALGDDAMAPFTLGEDIAGDAIVPGAGLDIRKVTVTPDPAGKRFRYAVEILDMPALGQVLPPFAYTVPLRVDDGPGAGGPFLAAGNAGSSFPPATAPWWAVCWSSSGTYECPTALTGTMNASGVTFTVSYARLGIQPGSVVHPRDALGCQGVCSLFWAAYVVSDTGDEAAVEAFRVPGRVTVGIGPAGTPPELVAADVVATVAEDGTFTASLPGGPGEHVVVARSCWGALDASVCVEEAVTVTV